MAAERIGIVGLESGLGSLLAGAGFTDVQTAVLRYLAGSATMQGLRWYQACLATFVVGRRLFVDVTRLMDGGRSTTGSSTPSSPRPSSMRRARCDTW